MLDSISPQAGSSSRLLLPKVNIMIRSSKPPMSAAQNIILRTNNKKADKTPMNLIANPISFCMINCLIALTPLNILPSNVCLKRSIILRRIFCTAALLRKIFLPSSERFRRFLTFVFNLVFRLRFNSF